MVVDPGVGTARRPIVMEAGGQYFVAPDNGVLSMIYAREKHKIRLISSGTVFPAAGEPHISRPRYLRSRGGAPGQRECRPRGWGRLIDDYLRPAFEKPQQTGKRAWNGRILKIDRFGNIVTNFHTDDFPGLERRDFLLTVGGKQIGVLARNYTEAGTGELFAIVGSSGYLEVSGNQMSAAKESGCQSGAPVELNVW